MMESSGERRLTTLDWIAFKEKLEIGKLN